MSDTSKSTIVRLRRESRAFTAMRRLLERKVQSDEVNVVISFAEIFLSKATESFLQKRSPDALAHMTLGAWRFLQSTDSEAVDVQVFNPNADNEGWHAPVTVFRTNISERPFVIDSLREFIHSQELSIEHIVYPVIHVVRNGEGRVIDVRTSEEGGARESLVHCEITQITDAELRVALTDQIRSRLEDVIRVTDDFSSMLDKVDGTMKDLKLRAKESVDLRGELLEIGDFFSWLQEGAFVFLGSCTYRQQSGNKMEIDPDSKLGVLRSSDGSGATSLDELIAEMDSLVQEGPNLFVTKTNTRATVHRLSRIDYVGLKKLDEKGELVEESVFLGLFTSRVEVQSAEDIPILRRKLKMVLESAEAKEGSHDYKAINTIFSSMPKEELFLSSVERIAADAQVVLTSYNTDDVRVTLHQDPVRSGTSVMVIISREKFSGSVRRAIEKELSRVLQSQVLNYHLTLGDGDQARLHFYLAPSDDKLPTVDATDLELMVQEIILSWSDRLLRCFERVRPADEARQLVRAYSEAFGLDYKAATDPAVALDDILVLEEMVAEEIKASISFSDSLGENGEAPATTEMKLYLIGEKLVLSDFMPIIDNMALRVIEVVPYEIEGEETPDAAVYSFSVQRSSGGALMIQNGGSSLAEAILAVRAGDSSNDGLNALVLRSSLSWREVDVLRAYASYAFQLGMVQSRTSLVQSLIRYPAISRTLFEIFAVKFDGSQLTIDERKKEVEGLESILLHSLRSVKSLSEDRALRGMLALVDASVRTNYYKYGGKVPNQRSGGVPYLSFKIAVRDRSDVVRTNLLYEIWVQSSRMQGIHLRGARVARGGIRYSDRPDDFRTEVLGLVNTQMVKNSVIVPAGSKGGFITLHESADPAEMAVEAKEQYKTLIRGMLDITDNIATDGSPLPPSTVVCWDGPDPYLVVAADKGTSKYSDMANDVAEEYDFWLDDAFASGGSNGYDHKVIGITARGGWECVKRHFSEEGIDIQSEPFTVVGIGDMSGDVFGNGMLLSQQIQLKAAFDYRHVFIDPNPDVASSYKERHRLFQLGKSSWDDYDRSCLSQGGMIISREAKEVNLTPEARVSLGIAEDAQVLNGEELVRAVLQAPVDLLWNGGIGTYVKSSEEEDSDVEDSTNDNVRIDADQLRCRVVGEGGNLGFTQKARVDFALRSGRINTDALDNSGGVNLSDREVNLKILLGQEVRSGTMIEAERNALLEQLTDAVALLVLEDNKVQSITVSMDEIRARVEPDDFRDVISFLEKSGDLTREDEDLPSWETLCARIEEKGRSLTRPELYVVMAYVKMKLMSLLLRSRLPDDPATQNYLRDYFPEEVLAVISEDGLGNHRLGRQIIASQMTNDVIGLMGCTFVHRLSKDMNRTPADVVRAWLVSARLTDHEQAICQASDNLPYGLFYQWMVSFSEVLERSIRWSLINLDMDADAAGIVQESQPKINQLMDTFSDFVSGQDRSDFDKHLLQLKSQGVTGDVADHLIKLQFFDQLLVVVQVAEDTNSELSLAAEAYYEIADRFQVRWLMKEILEVVHSNRWEERAANTLLEDLNRHLYNLARTKLVAMERENEVKIYSRGHRLFCSLIDDMKSEDAMSVAALSVAVRQMAMVAEKARLEIESQV